MNRAEMSTSVAIRRSNTLLQKTGYLTLAALPDKEGQTLAKCSCKGVLILRNMRLVAHVVKKYQGTDHDMEDLISVGTIGLIKAINTFNIDKGSRLATYAAKCVENEILMLLRAGKKYSKEVSLFEPIGVDKDGETVSLVDVIEMSYVSRIEKKALEKMRREMEAPG